MLMYFNSVILAPLWSSTPAKFLSWIDWNSGSVFEPQFQWFLVQLSPAVGFYFEERHKTLLVSTQSALDVSPACQRSALVRAHTHTQSSGWIPLDTNSGKHTWMHITLYSLYTYHFFSCLISIKPSCGLFKSLEALDSCGSQTNDFIWVSLSTLLFRALQAPELFFLSSPFFPQPRPPSHPWPAGAVTLMFHRSLMLRCRRAHWSHTSHVYRSVSDGKSRLVWCIARHSNASTSILWRNIFLGSRFWWNENLCVCIGFLER